MSRPRTLSCTSARSCPFSEFSMAGPGLSVIFASCPSGNCSPGTVMSMFSSDWMSSR
jgi:hypothetical protein